jgi:hypothetical protein
MFFLSIHTNVLIYCLVSSFLFLCLYSKADVEATVRFQYEQTENRCTEVSVVTTMQKENLDSEYQSPDIVVRHTILYKSRYISADTPPPLMRAPPLFA